MTVLIIGADRVAPLVPRLKDLGVEEILHWDTRNRRASKGTIPKRTELVIFCTDFLSHDAAKNIKRQVKGRKIPAIYCRRAWSEMACDVEDKIRCCRNRDSCPHAQACCKRTTVQ